MYLVIGARDDRGYWVRQIADRRILQLRLDQGDFKGYGQKEDVVFVEELPRDLDTIGAFDNDFNNNEIFIVEVKRVIIPKALKVTTQYWLEG